MSELLPLSDGGLKIRHHVASSPGPLVMCHMVVFVLSEFIH